MVRGCIAKVKFFARSYIRNIILDVLVDSQANREEIWLVPYRESITFWFRLRHGALLFHKVFLVFNPRCFAVLLAGHIADDGVHGRNIEVARYALHQLHVVVEENSRREAHLAVEEGVGQCVKASAFAFIEHHKVKGLAFDAYSFAVLGVETNRVKIFVDKAYNLGVRIGQFIHMFAPHAPVGVNIHEDFLGFKAQEFGTFNALHGFFPAYPFDLFLGMERRAKEANLKQSKI